MISKTQSKPSSELPPTPLVQLLHRGKARYTLEDLQQGQRSHQLLLSRLLSSPLSESSRQILISLEVSSLANSKVLDDHLMSLSEMIRASSSQEDSETEK